MTARYPLPPVHHPGAPSLARAFPYGRPRSLSDQHTIARLAHVLHPPRPPAAATGGGGGGGDNGAAAGAGAAQKLLYQNTLGVARLDNYVHFDGCGNFDIISGPFPRISQALLRRHERRVLC